MDQNIAVLSGFRRAPFALLLGIGGTWILGCTSTKPEQVVDTEQTGLKQNIPSRTSQAEHWGLVFDRDPGNEHPSEEDMKHAQEGCFQRSGP